MPVRRLHVWMLLAVSPCLAAQEGYYRKPALRGEQVVFTAEGDLWRVSVQGGLAQRLTTHPGEETDAAISPDGRMVAFSGGYAGSRDAFVMPLDGGDPKRVSFDDGRVGVVGFNSAGHVVYVTRNAASLLGPVLREVDPASGARNELPLADARGYADDGAGTVWFTRFGLVATADNARAYRGGASGELWRWQRDRDAEASRIGGTGSVSNPMWWDGRVYVIDDADGVRNLWSMAADGSDRRALTAHADYEVRSASLDGGRIVYQHGADLRLFDIASGRDARIAISLGSDRLQRQPRFLKQPLKHLRSATMSGNGERVVLGARGRVAVTGIGPRRRVELAIPDGARARDAVLSQDAKTVYLVLDQDEGSEVWAFAADGSDRGRALTTGGDARRWHLYLSPDDRWLAHDDLQGRLWLTDLVGGETRLVDDARFGGDDAWDAVVWSRDARLLALVRPDSNMERRQLFLYELASARLERLSSDRYESFAPAFSRDGHWLYFLSARHFATTSNVWQDRDMGPAFDRRVKAYALALSTTQRFPFQAADEQTPPPPKDEVKPPATIAYEGLAARLYELPLAPANYEALGLDDKRLYLLERASAVDAKADLKSVAIDAVNPKVEIFAAHVEQFMLSNDAKKLFFAKAGADDSVPGPMYIVDAGAKAPDDLSKLQVRAEDWVLPLDPRAEWRQMFDDAWRMHRSFAYDPRMRGVDWDAVRARYAPLVERIGDRLELDDVLAQMASELGALHSQVGGGDLRGDLDAPKPARLGAQYEDTGTGLRIAHLYRGDPELPSERGPLLQPALDVRVDDLIVAVNGRSVASESELATALVHQAGQQVLLRLRRGESERDLVVVPVDAGRDAKLRYQDWVQSRRERVAAASDGRIGYLHLRAMGGEDIAVFARDFYAQVERDGLVIDVRRNSGGNIDSWIIEKLMRRAWAYWQKPGQGMTWNMQQSFRGQLVVLADQQTYSDGETFTAGIKALGLGPVIGMRTAGAGVWLSDRNELSDGGSARIAEYPQFDIRGRWIIEGRGVSPDIEVDNLPVATARGGDAQLDAAVANLLERLEQSPPALPQSESIPPLPATAQ
jgi:tricorn protease